KELAAWAAGKGYGELRVDGHYLPTNEWPVLDRFKEHNIEVVINQISISKKTEKALTALIDEALAVGNGLLMVSATDTTSGSAAKAASGTTGKSSKKNASADALFSTRRACPSCGDSFDDLDPRLFSFNSKHGWCH